MYRFLALAIALLAAGCGGGGASFMATPTSTIPSATNTSTQAVAGTATQGGAPTASPTPPGSYTVADGDTLWDIATRFNTTVEALVAANNLANADDLSVGQVLTISSAAATTQTPTPTRAAQ